MNKILLFSLSLIFFISGAYFFVKQNNENMILFSEKEANIVSERIKPMLAEHSGVEIFYEDFVLDFNNNNVIINLKFSVKGFSLSFNGFSKFNSNFINKNNQFYLSDVKYDDFKLVNKNENTDFANVFLDKYNSIIKSKVEEDLNSTLKISPIHDLKNQKEIFVNEFHTEEDNLVINTKEYNKYYDIYYIISFILSIFCFIIPFLFKTKNN